MGYIPDVPIPIKVVEAIGYDGWSALSWALCNGWVQDYKHLLSEKEGRDVGVPETIDLMLHPENDKHQVLSRGAMYMFPSRVKSEDYGRFRNLMIGGYLLGTDFVSTIDKPNHGITQGVIHDEDGENQLEGEIRRHLAGIVNVKPFQVILTTSRVLIYCEKFGLEDAYEDFCRRLKLKD